MKNYHNPDDWVAPEHERVARHMQRDFPRDYKNRPIRDDRGRMLKVDPRPTILIPERKTYKDRLNLLGV